MMESDPMPTPPQRNDRCLLQTFIIVMAIFLFVEIIFFALATHFPASPPTGLSPTPVQFPKEHPKKSTQPSQSPFAEFDN